MVVWVHICGLHVNMLWAGTLLITETARAFTRFYRKFHHVFSHVSNVRTRVKPLMRRVKSAYSQIEILLIIIINMLICKHGLLIALIMLTWSALNAVRFMLIIVFIIVRFSHIRATHRWLAFSQSVSYDCIVNMITTNWKDVDYGHDGWFQRIA